MFDEFNEGNQIAKTAETAAWVPAGSRHPGAGRGRHLLLVRLLPADHRRRRPDAQGPAAADRGPAHPAGRRHHAAAPVRRPGRRPADQRQQHQGGFPGSNAVDGNPGSYWESANNAVPAMAPGRSGRGVRRVASWCCACPPAGRRGRRPSTVQTSTDGTTFSTASPSAGCTFSPVRHDRADPASPPGTSASPSPATPAGRPPARGSRRTARRSARTAGFRSGPRQPAAASRPELSRQTPSTATRARTGRARTTPSRSGSRSTSARPPGRPGGAAAARRAGSAGRRP